MFQYGDAWLILGSVEEFIIFEHGRYISALEDVRMLILSRYILLACKHVSTSCKYGQA